MGTSLGSKTLHLRAGPNELARTVRHSIGVLSKDEKEYIPEGERRKAVLFARLVVAMLTAVVATSILTSSLLPLLLIGLPTFYGSWMHSLLATMQHAGLAEDMPDHRLNSRTVLLNPLFRFVYANMNYHVEHHMFPMVPYYSLPKLHEEIRADCPPPYNGVFEAYREILPAIRRQLRDPGYFVIRQLPAGAGT